MNRVCCKGEFTALVTLHLHNRTDAAMGHVTLSPCSTFSSGLTSVYLPENPQVHLRDTAGPVLDQHSEQRNRVSPTSVWLPSACKVQLALYCSPNCITASSVQ